MTITYPVDVPLDDVSEVSVGSNDASSFVTSPFTARGVAQEFEADYWTLTLRYRNLSRQLAQPVIAFANSLRRAKGTFVIPFPGYDSTLGNAKENPSSPTVNGSGQAGSEVLEVTSAPVSLANWLLAGDVIQVGPASRPHWHRVLENVNTTGSGTASIDVWPRVREGSVNGDQISLETPLCLFRVIENFSLDLTSPTIHSVDLICREAI